MKTGLQLLEIAKNEESNSLHYGHWLSSSVPLDYTV